MKGTAKTTRLRLVKCSECGYNVRMTRTWITTGLPKCPNPDCAAHELAMTCADPADAIECGLMTLDDLPRRLRTEVCRRMGWEDEIIRTSPSQAPGSRRIKLRRPADAIPF